LKSFTRNETPEQQQAFDDAQPSYKILILIKLRHWQTAEVVFIHLLWPDVLTLILNKLTDVAMLRTITGKNF
jgi:hypothetical protein